MGITWEGFVQYPIDAGTLAWSDPVSVFATCTGWFASEEGHIVTAGHCVDPVEGKGALIEQFLAQEGAEYLLPEALATWPVEGELEGSDPLRSVEVVQPPAVDGTVITTPMTVQVLDYQPLRDGDVAVLKANGLTEPSPALPVAISPAAIGDDVTAIGFPGSVQAVSDISRIRASFKSGTVSSSQISPDGVAGTEVNADISGGMSGGPTINGQAEVLGVNSFIINGEQRNFNFITDASALRSYLERQYIELAAAASTPVPDAPRPEPVAEREESSGTPVWLFAVAGVAILALGGALMVLLRRRSTPQAAGYPAGPMAQGPMGQAPMPQAPMAPAPMGQAPMPQVPAPRAPVGQVVPDTSADHGCHHGNNPPGARFCQDCGDRLVNQV